MPVMTAGMHGPRRLGRIVEPRLLMDRQRIHIRAQTNGAARSVCLTLDDPHNASAAQPRHDLIAAKLFQLLRHDGRGPVGLKQDFRVFMKIAAPFG